MDAWHSTFLGIRQPPRELSAFELKAFFTFDGAERAVIDERRTPALRPGLALHIGFLRMSGRSLDAFRIVPPALWRQSDRDRLDAFVRAWLYEQLPDLFLEIDAQVRFSWIMLGREPRLSDELLIVYAGILAQGTTLSAAETARMIPPLSPASVRQAMRWVGDERRLADANTAVLTFMQRHPIAATWGREDRASSDMMSLETTKRVWQARVDPSQLAVDTHGYTDFAMTLARLLGFDLCPRLKSLRERRLFVPRGWEIPASLRTVCAANVEFDAVPDHWDALVNLAASVHRGHASAVAVMASFGSCAKGDPIYEAGVQIGRLLRTAFLTDYFVNAGFRREILRVLNRGEAVNALKRLIYAGRVANVQARRSEEMNAVAEALNLIANIVMAWNTAQMQAALDGWANRRQVIPPELIGRIAPTHVEGINLRGIFRFPIDRFAERLLPSQAAPKLRAGA